MKKLTFIFFLVGVTFYFIHKNNKVIDVFALDDTGKMVDNVIIGEDGYSVKFIDRNTLDNTNSPGMLFKRNSYGFPTKIIRRRY